MRRQCLGPSVQRPTVFCLDLIGERSTGPCKVVSATVSKYQFAFAVSVFFEYGGMQRTLLRIAEECVNRGHEVHVFTGRWLAERPERLTVHELDIRALTNVGKNDKLAERLEHAVGAGDYDCVVGFNKIPGLDVYYAGDPCYAARVDETKGALYKLLPRYRGLMRQEAAVFSPMSDAEILLIAHQEREKFMRYYGTNPERFHLLPPGINRQRLVQNGPNESERRALRREHGLGDSDHMLLNVGSRFKTKGIDRILRSLQALPHQLRQKSKLVVIGGDNPRPFTRLARRLNIADRVAFVGARQDVAAYYYAADALIHPSYTENTGTTLIEAMICGLPVLTTENCGFAFHVRDADAGLVCPMPFSQRSFNAMLTEILSSSRREDWRRNGSLYCERTDLYSLIERAADVIIARARKNRDY